VLGALIVDAGEVDVTTVAAVEATISKTLSLILDSRVLCDQHLNERTQQRFASLSDIVHKLKETEVKREFLL